MKDVGLAAESQSSNIVVVDDAASPPGARPSPHRMTAILQAMAFGLALGIGLAFLIEYQDKTLKTPDEVELSAAAEPGRGAVLCAGRREAVRQAHRINGNGTADLPAKNLEIAGSLSRYSVIGEAYRALRTALMLSRAGSPPKSILITSAVELRGQDGQRDQHRGRFRPYRRQGSDHRCRPSTPAMPQSTRHRKSPGADRGAGGDE